MQPSMIIGKLQSLYPKEEIQKRGFLTSILGFTKLINQAKSAQEASNILIKLESLDIQANVITFTSLINKAETFEEALTYLEKSHFPE